MVLSPLKIGFPGWIIGIGIPANLDMLLVAYTSSYDQFNDFSLPLAVDVGRVKYPTTCLGVDEVLAVNPFPGFVPMSSLGPTPERSIGLIVDAGKGA